MNCLGCGHEPLHAKGMCQRCYDAAYRKANRERRAATNAAWREANRERIAAYREANRGRLAATYAAWYQANRERKAATYAAWYKANRERKAAYCKANRELWRQQNNRRRARQAGTAIVDRLDKALPCGVCGGFIDHTLPYPDPMSPSIGHEPPLALQPAESITRYEHLRCNLAKGTKTDDELLERMAS